MLKMLYEELEWTPAVAERRRFGIGAGAGFSTLAALLSWRGGGLTPGATVAVAAGLTLLCLAAVCPAMLLWPYRIWMGLVTPVAFVVQRLLLGVFFYAVLAPVGLAMRLFGRDPLKRRFDPAAASYWEAGRPAAGMRRYFRQY
jgi:hypothetical protein